jgi:hypothetical protein
LLTSPLPAHSSFSPFSLSLAMNPSIGSIMFGQRWLESAWAEDLINNRNAMPNIIATRQCKFYTPAQAQQYKGEVTGKPCAPRLLNVPNSLCLGTIIRKMDSEGLSLVHIPDVGTFQLETVRFLQQVSPFP